MSERKPVWYAEVTFYDDGTLQQTNGTSFEKWLAEHDAALIEGLADEARQAHGRGGEDSDNAFGAWVWLEAEARQRREEQGR